VLLCFALRCGRHALTWFRWGVQPDQMRAVAPHSPFSRWHVKGSWRQLMFDDIGTCCCMSPSLPQPCVDLHSLLTTPGCASDVLTAGDVACRYRGICLRLIVGALVLALQAALPLRWAWIAQAAQLQPRVDWKLRCPSRPRRVNQFLVLCLCCSFECMIAV
jgi:hypothetical protein